MISFINETQHHHALVSTFQLCQTTDSWNGCHNQISSLKRTGRRHTGIHNARLLACPWSWNVTGRRRMQPRWTVPWNALFINWISHSYQWCQYQGDESIRKQQVINCSNIHEHHWSGLQWKKMGRKRFSWTPIRIWSHIQWRGKDGVWGVHDQQSSRLLWNILFW